MAFFKLCFALFLSTTVALSPPLPDCPIQGIPILPHSEHCQYVLRNITFSGRLCPMISVDCNGGSCRDACTDPCDDCLIDHEDPESAECIKRDNCPEEIVPMTRMSSPVKAGVREGRCLQPAVTGPCRAYFPSYYYDWTKKTCERFVYGGCGGNDNRFDKKDNCEANCKRRKLTKKERCSLPPTGRSQIQCLAAIPKFVYDRDQGKCVSYTYGGCFGTENLFDTMEKCTTSCSGLPKCPPRNTTRAESLPQGCTLYRTSYIDGAKSFCDEEKIRCHAHAGTCPDTDEGCVERCENNWDCQRSEKCCGSCCKIVKKFDFRFDYW